MPPPADHLPEPQDSAGDLLAPPVLTPHAPSRRETIRAAIFDMDGVLTDSEPLINAAAVAMFKELGLQVQPGDFHPFVGTGENRYLGGVAEKYGFPIDLPSAKRRTYEIYLDLVPTRLRAFPGAVDLVRACRDAGFKVALASSADRIKIDANLQKIGLPPACWDAIVTGEDVEHKKPAPDIFLAAARKLDCQPAQCVVVEDAINGVQAAKAAGIRCVAVAQSFPASQLQEADAVFGSVADISLAALTGGNEAPTGRAPAGPWGVLPTIGMTLAIAAGFFIAQTAAAAALILGLRLFEDTATAPPLAMPPTGLLWAVATLASAPVEVGLMILFAWLRRGYPVRDYLALHPPAAGALLRWGLLLLGFAALTDGITWLLGKPIVPEFVREACETAVVPPLLWFAVIVLAPASEELFFRGFLFRGLEVTRLGGWGAILVSSLLWASLHFQYDLFGILVIFGAGLLLGYARLATGSLYPSLLMHALMNALATVQAAVLATTI